MSDGDAIYRSILIDPSDDGPRLAYADWLEAEGDDRRSAFIRTQIRAHPAGLGQMASSRGRLPELANRQPWSGSMKRITFPGRIVYWNRGRSSVQWGRGFVDTVGTTMRELLIHAEALFKAHPIERVLLDSHDVAIRQTRSNFAIVGGQYYLIARSALAQRHFGNLFRSTHWPTSQAAERVLSDYLVDHCRSLAGLPVRDRSDPLPLASPANAS